MSFRFLRIFLKEINAGKVPGPYRSRPFPNLCLLPIDLVSKIDG